MLQNHLTLNLSIIKAPTALPQRNRLSAHNLIFNLKANIITRTSPFRNEIKVLEINANCYRLTRTS